VRLYFYFSPGQFDFLRGSRPGKLGRSMLRPYMNLHWANAQGIEFEPGILGKVRDLGNDSRLHECEMNRF
jgi:hypothetical protein